MPELTRWRHADYSPQSISVIESAKERPETEGAQRVPFGFARALPRQPQPEVEPILWEGDDA